MKLTINLKARLQRHSRGRHLLVRRSFFASLKRFRFIALFVTVLLPFYPSLGAFGYSQETAVGDYDETTIITAYEGDAEDAYYSKDSGFIKPTASFGDVRDVSGVNRLIAYTVESGDSFSSISDEFRVSMESILWANDFSRDTVLKPGMSIKIPPVSGVVYRVASGDTLDTVAKKFKVSAEKIREQNGLGATGTLVLGKDLIIPGAAKIREVPPAADTKKLAKDTKKTDPKNAKLESKKLLAQKNAKKNANIASKRYSTAYTGKGNKFAWGNCTYFVANHKNVTWRGNARDWLRNASAAGVATGGSAAPGAIISFSGRGYNAYYGHVGIVADVDGDDIIVKDMNYRRINEVTIRRISKNDPSIRGYIYSD